MSSRRRSTFGPGSGSLLLGAGSGARRRRSTFGPRGGGGGGRRFSGRLLAVLAVVVGAVVVAVLLVQAHGRRDDRKAAATHYATAWARRDTTAMWRSLTPSARERWPLARFTALVRAADAAAGVTAVRTGRPGKEDGGRITIPVAVATRDFGTLRGSVALPVSGGGSDAGVDWVPSLRLPGLRAGETVRRRSGRAPARASILAADGTRLASDPLGASIAGEPGPPATGLERLYAARLAGHPSERLLFGARTIRQVPARRGRTLHTTIRPGLQRRAAAALGNRLGGVAVVRPRDGAVLALAGLAVSAPQPPGSTFKIITLSAALTHGAATPSSSYPVRQYAVLSGTKLANASNESCGGALATAFAESCNSVFAPLGAKVGAKRLVAMAEAFGFNEKPRIPAAKPSTIGPASKLPDSLAVGAAAIGQDRDLATPLQMASVGATIGNHGRRVRLRIAESDPVVRRRVVSPKVAAEVRTMMLGVVRSGTGTAAALPGIQVAGKTGTAELRPTAGGPPDPKNTDAWFVAFAPARKPKVAVAVMLVGAGAGGKAAAPIARQVLAAALS